MQGSVLFEIHSWRGFRTARDLFFVGVVAGFCSLYVSKQSIVETLEDFKRRLEKAREKLGNVI